MSEKALLRAEARKRLRSLRLDDRVRRGAAIEASVWSVPEIRSARRILLYASMAEEVPTDAIAREARLRGIEAVYPRCAVDSVAMTLHLVEHEEALLTGGRFGVREPAPDCKDVDPESIDVAFLPGLGWDRRGHRLGRGAGYYDRLLAGPDWRGLRAGLFFSVQEFAAIPTDPWDIPLDIVITENGIVLAEAPSATDHGLS
jgi:5-formyltetrahydrofolate cyclo-ligase